MIRILLLFSLVIFLARCSDQRDSIVFVGDSMNYNGGIEQPYTFPALLEKQLKTYRVVDLSKPNQTTNYFLENLDEITSDFPSGLKFIFIQLGINDLKVYGHNESTITNCVTNMQSILSEMKNRFPEVQIVVLSNTKIDYGSMDEEMKAQGYSQSTNQYLSQIAEGYSMIAADNKCNFVDLHRQVPINSTSDGFHLNKIGNNITAMVINTFLRNFILANPVEKTKN